MDVNVTRESVMFTESDDLLIDFAKFRKVSKSAEEYPEAFVEAIRNSAVKSRLSTSSSCSPRSSYTDSKSSLIKINNFFVYSVYRGKLCTGGCKRGALHPVALEDQ